MMSNTRDNRKREMRAAHEAGRDAFDEGKTIRSVPPSLLDQGHWRTGWHERQHEEQQHEQDVENNYVQRLIDAVPCDATRAALEAIWEKVNG